MNPLTTTVTLIGGIGSLIGLALKVKDIYGRWDRILWHRYLKAVTESYQDQQSHTRFAYPRVPDAIPLECTKNREPSAFDLVTLLVNSATSTVSPKPLLVSGEYGQGKSVACGDLANRLAIYSRQHYKTRHIPILVRLQDNPDLQNLDSSSSRIIQALYTIHIDESVIKRAAIQGRLVYIFDGADEYLSNADPDAAYTWLSKLAEQTIFRKNTLVVTSRPNIITAAHLRRLQESFDIVHITFPRLSQIFEYLKRRGQIEMISIAQRPGNEHFAELIKRPLFLDMAVATADLIPDTVPINDATLFDHYFESWYLRELSKLSHSNPRFQPSTSRRDSFGSGIRDVRQRHDVSFRGRFCPICSTDHGFEYSC